MCCLLGEEHFISGGVEENVPEQSIYFFPVRKQFFYFTMSKKQILFFSAYCSKPTGHTASFHINMCNSIGSESSVGLH